jgi:hypothetical protein
MLTKWHICDNNYLLEIGKPEAPNSAAIPLPVRSQIQRMLLIDKGFWLFLELQMLFPASVLSQKFV